MIEGLKLAAGDVSLSLAMPRDKTDEDQLELAVRQHAQIVYRIAYSVLRNHHDAEDVTQEVFLRVFRHRGKLHEVREIRGWVARIAWRVSIGRKKKTTEISLDDVVTIATQFHALECGAEELLLRQEKSAILEKLIASLPARLRGPLLLSTVEELSPAEIARILKTSEAAVRSRLFRARQVLRERLTTLVDSKHETR